MEMPSNRFRRKFLFELTVEESDLLDRLGRVHGSRRAAILAALQAQDGGELVALRQRVSDLEGTLAAAKAVHERDAAALATAKAEAKQGKTRAADLKAEQIAHRQTKAELKTTTAHLAEVRRSLTQAQAECQRLLAEQPEQAYCPSCRKLVPRAEWALQSTEQGTYVYHKPDGFRPSDTLLRGTATVLFVRPAAPRGSGT